MKLCISTFSFGRTVVCFLAVAVLCGIAQGCKRDTSVQLGEAESRVRERLGKPDEERDTTIGGNREVIARFDTKTVVFTNGAVKEVR